MGCKTPPTKFRARASCQKLRLENPTDDQELSIRPFIAIPDMVSYCPTVSLSCVPCVVVFSLGSRIVFIGNAQSHGHTAKALWRSWIGVVLCKVEVTAGSLGDLPCSSNGRGKAFTALPRKFINE